MPTKQIAGACGLLLWGAVTAYAEPAPSYECTPAGVELKLKQAGKSTILVDGVSYALQLDESDPLLKIDTYTSRTEQRFIRVEAWASAAVIHVLPEPTPKEVSGNPAASLQWLRDKRIRYQCYVEGLERPTPTATPLGRSPFPAPMTFGK